MITQYELTGHIIVGKNQQSLKILEPGTGGYIAMNLKFNLGQNVTGY